MPSRKVSSFSAAEAAEPVVGLHQDLGIEPVDAAEVVVDGRGVAAGPLGDLLAGGMARALFGEDRPGGLEDLQPRGGAIVSAAGRLAGRNRSFHGPQHSPAHP